jgi:hypothetical protein
MPIIDGLIATTALVHDLILVTRNVNDVERSGASILNVCGCKFSPLGINGSISCVRYATHTLQPT